jgi:hypothetical protein
MLHLATQKNNKKRSNKMFKTVHKTIFSLLAISLIVFLMAACIPASPVAAAGLEISDQRGGPGGNNQGGGSGNGAGTGSGIAMTALSPNEADGLEKAILEEYKAFNLYQSVLDQMGDVYPFNQIIRSEQQHINALVRQAEKYGVPVPSNPGLIPEPMFADLPTACQAGVAAEIEDAALYDTLKIVTTHTDILGVYDKLQSASLNSHLIEFQTCD